MILELLAQASDASARPFNTVRYTGTGAIRTLPVGVDASAGGLTVLQEMAPPAFTDDAALYDTVRGASRRARDQVVEDIVSAITFDGPNRIYTGATYNVSGRQYLSFHFQKRVKFMDIVLFTSGESNVPHALTETPECAIVVRRTGGAGITHWFTGGAELSGVTNAVFTPEVAAFPAGTYVAYLFSAGSGQALVGSYVGNGDPTQNVALAFAPKWILVTDGVFLSTAYWDLPLADTAHWSNGSAHSFFSVSGTTLTAGASFNGLGVTYNYLMLR